MHIIAFGLHKPVVPESREYIIDSHNSRPIINALLSDISVNSEMRSSSAITVLQKLSFQLCPGIK